MMMDPPRNYRMCSSLLAITAAFLMIFISLNLFHPLSTGGKFKTVSANAMSGQQQQQLRKKLVLGSKPPTCMNKCMNCRPCQATLVIPPHPTTKAATRVSYVISSHRSSQDDTYYLLSWKCRCGNKLYQP